MTCLCVLGFFAYFYCNGDAGFLYFTHSLMIDGLILEAKYVRPNILLGLFFIVYFLEYYLSGSFWKVKIAERTTVRKKTSIRIVHNLQLLVL